MNANIQYIFSMASSGIAQTFEIILCILLIIVIFSKFAIGRDIVNGIFKEKDHQNEVKFSIGRFLLMISLVVYISIDLTYKKSCGTATPTFTTNILNVLDYSWKVTGILLTYVFGNKVTNAAHAYFKGKFSGNGNNNSSPGDASNSGQPQQ